MIAGSNRNNTHESGPDGVTLALELLLEEIKRETDRVKGAGSDAILADDHDTVLAILAQTKVLTEFYDKAVALRKEWGRLAISTDPVGVGKSGSGRRDFGKLRKGLRTSESEFIEPILRVLIEMGGRGKTATVVARVGEVMQAVLCDVDYETLASDGKPRWKKAANWARDHMVRGGLLRSDSPHGLREISQEGRSHLES